LDAPKSPKPSVAATSGNASAELEKLRAAHQKLQAEAVSLRAKAGLVSEEEQEAQAEIVKVASEIATLSTMLEELRAQVMESKVKLADAVATLKAQKEKKESLETAVEETRETYDALNSATEALVEANEDAMAHQAKAVAAAAAAKEEAEAPSADLFSWDSPAPAAAGAAPVPLESEPMGQQEAPAPAMQAMGTPWGEQPGQPVASEPPVVADAGSVYSSVPQPPVVADAGSVYSTSSAQQSVTGANVWGGANGYGGDISQQTMPQQVPTNQYPNNMMNGLGAQPMQQNMMTPVVNTAAQPVQHLPTIESPTAEQIDQLKKDALIAEKSFRSSKDLVSTLKKEVKHLEAAAAKAEEEKKAIESKKKKIGGKKKQKKEIEKAYEFAMGEQKKVAEAREQLDAARRQSDVAKAEADKLRQQYEEAEVEAATAASYMSVNASNSVAPSVGGGSVVAQQHYQQQYQQPAPTNDAYADPFGMGASMGQPAAVTASDPYGMGLMGGSANGDYANPFAM
jgi:septal ring factor EnvC (AmiA/AmiB activator)